MEPIHVIPYREGWDVTRLGARYAESHHATLEEAVKAGAALARRQKVELMLHTADGRVEKAPVAPATPSWRDSLEYRTGMPFGMAM
ncbi:DUF2188 domain-containing protein [Cupriavidus respiraculi]|uniref:DUF2188 domain-containing protein n=1 Tax=Cupriavidus respiraculi TaxID=195930 RepID=UPI001C9860AA|nr:DUF2188 domain-containing protein [Cupriavidus respiraculi]MBY4947342.1 DUF2188 domain-containing protein [Cupriavidus respiraculi]